MYLLSELLKVLMLKLGWWQCITMRWNVMQNIVLFPSKLRSQGLDFQEMIVYSMPSEPLMVFANKLGVVMHHNSQSVVQNIGMHIYVCAVHTYTHMHAHIHTCMLACTHTHTHTTSFDSRMFNMCCFSSNMFLLASHLVLLLPLSWQNQTPDMGGKATTTDIIHAVIEEIKPKTRTR